MCQLTLDFFFCAGRKGEVNPLWVPALCQVRTYRCGDRGGVGDMGLATLWGLLHPHPKLVLRENSLGRSLQESVASNPGRGYLSDSAHRLPSPPYLQFHCT